MTALPTRIGLIRHFPVIEPLPRGWISAADLHRWSTRYDEAAVIVGDFDIGASPWAECISSDLPRAVTTARTVFNGHIELTSLLREPKLAQFATGDLRMPFVAWSWLLRFAWLSGHSSQREGRDDFKRRVLAVADLLLARNSDTLVVSHGGMMAYLSAELCRRGCSGPAIRVARHARVYVFERPAQGGRADTTR